MVHNVISNRSRLFFFFFALQLEKLEALGKICEVASSHTYVSMTKGVSSTATV